MRKIHIFIAFTLLIMSLMSGCISQEEKAIQGKWADGNAHYWMEWTFDRGIYSYYNDNGFTHISETGRYNIIKIEEDYIDLQLFNREGGIREMMEETVELRIKFKEAGMINIKGSDYYQVYASSLFALETAKAPFNK